MILNIFLRTLVVIYFFVQGYEGRSCYLYNSYSRFECGDGTCIEPYYKCNGRRDCSNGRDERDCVTTTTADPCAQGYLCPNRQCVAKSSPCNGVSDCSDGSDEIKCDVTKVADFTYEKNQAMQWFLDKRSNSAVYKWGLQVHRAAVALFLANEKLFSPEHKTGQEIRYELTIHLLSVLNRRAILRTELLSLYVHAMVVSCLNPHDFHGHDLVSELRKRVNFSKYTNPLAILVLCNAGANMTIEDVDRLNGTYFNQHRTYWTEIQVLSTMALSCISSKTDVFVDQEILQEWINSAKKIPLQNGTTNNPRTIALVIQMLLGTNYKEGFNWQAAVKAIKDSPFFSSSNFLDKYYLTPVLSNKGLTAIDSKHCSQLSYNVDLFASKPHMHTVRYTVWMDKEVDFGRSWRLKMNSSSTLYDVIQTVQRQDSTHTVKFNMVDGKPYVKSVSGLEEDPETDHYWFTYERTLGSAEDPKLLEDSPVDIHTREDQEIILWYIGGAWSSDSYGSGELP